MMLVWWRHRHVDFKRASMRLANRIVHSRQSGCLRPRATDSVDCVLLPALIGLLHLSPGHFQERLGT